METTLIISFLTLTFLEIVLGIDNIIFMSIVSDQLPLEKRTPSRNVGLGIAALMRLALLFVIAWINKLDATLFSYSGYDLSGKDIILAIGGMFLMYKSTTEIFSSSETGEIQTKKVLGFWSAILQISIINLVFSIDSVLTAIGLTSNITIMALSILASSIIMVFFSKLVSDYIAKHKSLKILALSFIMMVGLFLILDASHIHVPKGYIYAAIAFSLFVEFINIRFKTRK